jgi:hypothetical protein
VPYGIGGRGKDTVQWDALLQPARKYFSAADESPPLATDLDGRASISLCVHDLARHHFAEWPRFWLGMSGNEGMASGSA